MSISVRTWMPIAISMRWSMLSNHFVLVRDLHAMTAEALEANRKRAREVVAAANGKDGAAGQEGLRIWLNLAEADAYPSLQRAALFGLAFGSVEHELLGLCWEARRALPDAESVDDQRGSTLERVYSYLSKVASIDMSRVPEWKWFRAYGRVRNCLLHARGFAHDDKVSVEELAKRTNSLELNTTIQRINLKETFVPTFLDSASTLWEQLCVVWDERWTKA
jgi:hypothetical protein